MSCSLLQPPDNCVHTLRDSPEHVNRWSSQASVASGDVFIALPSSTLGLFFTSMTHR